MNKKIEAKVHDQTFVEVRIPMKNILGIVSDIGNLFKYKDENGHNIGATGETIDLKQTLEKARERYELECKLMVINKNE